MELPVYEGPVVNDAVDTFNAQPWRRVIKTHTPLKGLKFREDAFYVTCGRDPRDAFLSSLDHGENSALYGEPADVPTDRSGLLATRCNGPVSSNF